MKFVLPLTLLIAGLMPIDLAHGEGEEKESLSPVPPHWEASYWDAGSTETFWRKPASPIKNARSTRDSAAPQPQSPSAEHPSATPPSKKRTAHHSPQFLDRQTEK